MPAAADNNHNRAVGRLALAEIKRYGSRNQPDKFCHKARKFCNSINCSKQAAANKFRVMKNYLFDFRKLLSI